MPITVDIAKEPDTYVSLNQYTGVFTIPPKGYRQDDLVYWEMLEQSEDKLIFRLDRAYTSHTTLLRDTTIYTVTKQSDERYDLRVNYTESSVWLKDIKSGHDLVKNPLNKPIHKYIENGEPLYVSEKICIALDRSLYINVGKDFWIPIRGELEFISVYKDLVPKDYLDDIERYYLMKKLTESWEK